MNKKEKVNCLCGKKITRMYFLSHSRSDKHIKYVEEYKKNNENKEPDFSYIRVKKNNITEEPDYFKKAFKKWYNDPEKGELRRKKHLENMKKTYYSDKEKLGIRKRIRSYYKRKGIIRSEMTYKNKRKFIAVLKQLNKNS
ncbi:MAG: hypothetical protein CMJ25_02300 [Phycisphaerae bacterium]|nr:hypothetical protein [Phycisphaerae bacterium]|tara:strand:- start:3806 stop:4225 length:420 start_codon:yes stop_codon:yes gene_type:complete